MSEDKTASMVEVDDENAETLELVAKDVEEESVVKSHHQEHYYFVWVRPLAVEFITSMILIFNVCSLPWPGTHKMLMEMNELNATSTFQNLPLVEAQEMPLMPAFTAGLTVFALLTMFHYLSVAHISPTVTFGFAFGGVFDFKMVIPYLIAQILGAVCGAALAMAGSGNGSVVGAVELPELTNQQLTSLFIAEVQVSFILCLSTNLVVGNKKWDLPVASLMIGMCVFTGIMAGHLAGAGAMNPARVLGPAILKGNFQYHYIWWLASLVGAGQFAVIYRTFFAQEEYLFPFVKNLYQK